MTRTKKPLEVARTRKALLDALWEQFREADLNIYREGAKYVVNVRGRGGKMFACATGVRCIDSLSVADWRDLLNDKRWEVSEHRSHAPAA